MTGRIIATGLLMTLAAQVQAAAAAVPQELPPPGLYRVDNTTRKDEKVGPHEASTTFRSDGASGDQASRSVIADQDGGTRIDKGDAPLTQCIKAGAQVLPPAFAAAACKTQPPSRSAQGLVQVAACPTGKFTLRIRRLDATTWEYVTETDMSGGATSNLDSTRAMLQMAASSAASAADRARAARALADMPRLEASLTRDRGAAEAMMAQALAGAKTPQEQALARQAIARMHGQVPVRIHERTTLTRIAERCTAP